MVYNGYKHVVAPFTTAAIRIHDACKPMTAWLRSAACKVERGGLTFVHVCITNSFNLAKSPTNSRLKDMMVQIANMD